MIKTDLAIISVALFATMVSLAWLGWSRRTKGQNAQYSRPLEALEYFGEKLAEAKALYVATTTAENHLDRVSAHGLGHRGKASVFVFSEGLLIVRQGERPLAIAREQLVSVYRNQVAIDKVVESNGLISIDWLQSNQRLSTHLRIVDQSAATEISEQLQKILVKEVAK
jgi:hypothetical protein